MSDDLFREGGPYKIRRIGTDKYAMRIPIPEDADGRIARECPDADCSPGYFRVRPGTGITDGQEIVYCPYCRHAAEPSQFGTKEQLRYAKDVMMREAQEGIGRMVKDAFGLDTSGRRKIGGGFLSMELAYKQDSFPHVTRPFEEELLRAVLCPHCGLDHTVFGLATWCSDCGHDIFVTHVQAECEVVRKMLSDVDRRRIELGARIAARDIDNCLEDTVSIYEAVLKAQLTRALRERGIKGDEVQSVLDRRVRNGFQNVDRSAEIVEKELGIALFMPGMAEEAERLKCTFGKRHPITHNLGVVDKKYLESALSSETEGREIRVTAEEVKEAIEVTLGVLMRLHSRLFPPAGDT